MTDHAPAGTAAPPAQERLLAEMADRIAMLEQDRDRLDRLARARATELAARTQEIAALRSATTRPDTAPPHRTADRPAGGQEENLHDRLHALEAERARLQEALEHQARELARLRLRPARETSEVQILKRDMAKLQDRIADLQASTSWRITAPLRWLTLRLRNRDG